MEWPATSIFLRSISMPFLRSDRSVELAVVAGGHRNDEFFRLDALLEPHRGLAFLFAALLDLGGAALE